MRPGTLARLAIAGTRTDVLRGALTAASTALAVGVLLAAATVGAISGYAERYTNNLLVEPGLRPGVVTALVLVAVPVLALAGQCVRIGAPARDRRLAAIRLAGATPREAVLIATAETVVAGTAGAALGIVGYLSLRLALPGAGTDGLLALPTDVLPPAPVIVLPALAVPVVAGLIGAALMRRVIVTPLGVTRRVTRDHGPRPWPGLLLGIGVVCFWLPAGIGERVRMPDDLVLALLAAGLVTTVLAVVLGVGWISHTTGRLLRRFGRGPATLLAGQQLITDPWLGSRTLAAMLAALIVGSVALGFGAQIETEFAAYDRLAELNPAAIGMGLTGDREFYTGAVDLVVLAVVISAFMAAAGVLVALSESIVARRRTYAALTATGVPRRTLSAALLWQTLTPLIPALLLALCAGGVLIRLTGVDVSAGGMSWTECIDPKADAATCATRTVSLPLVEMQVPIPVDRMALLGGGALLAMLLAAGVALLVLRSSTDLEELRVG
ncbi:FtsX-like permease family protein [Actinoplanes sp. URMC 104]|uniref:FtsX-like permease family protein n=1 Tax=Actinoplanes sp. URMC 104 TaxID=3423409 RepID=UPI003F1CC176